MCRRSPGSNACSPGLSIARGLFLLLRGGLVVLHACPPDRATQEVGLLVRLLEAIATARLAPSASLHGLRRALGGALALLVGLAPLALAVAVAVSTIPVAAIPIPAVTAISTIAVVTVIALAAITIAEAALVAIAAEVPIVTPAAALVRPGMASLLMPRLGLRLEHRRRLQAVVEQIVAVLLAEVLATFARLARPPHAVAVGELAGLTQLLAIGHYDAGIVLGVLKVILRQHRVARGLGVSRQRKILLGDMRRGAPDFHVRPVGLETAR